MSPEATPARMKKTASGYFQARIVGRTPSSARGPDPAKADQGSAAGEGARPTAGTG